MKLNFLNGFQYIPGYVPDVCIGSPQKPCTKQYFFNWKDVGYKYNIVSTPLTPDPADTPTLILEFPRPFLLLGPAFMPDSPDSGIMLADANANSENIFGPVDASMPWLSSKQFGWTKTIQKMFQTMQECTVDNRMNAPAVPMGESVDGTIGYNELEQYGNFNFYFNNLTSPTQGLQNMENFIIPPQMIQSFWAWMNDATTSLTPITEFEVAASRVPEFARRLIEETDRRLWMAPGKYTVDMAGGIDWVDDLISLMAADFSGKNNFSLFALELKSIE